MIKKVAIAATALSAVAIVYIVAYSLFLLHGKLVKEREEEIMDQKLKNELLLLHTKELYEKINAYDTVLKEMMKSGCIPPGLEPQSKPKKDQEL